LRFTIAAAAVALLALPAAGDPKAPSLDEVLSGRLAPDAEVEAPFAGLISRLPSASASGRQIRSVAFVGLEPAESWRELAIAWLSPRVADARAVERALSDAARARFRVSEAPFSAEGAPHASAIQRGAASAETIATANLALAVDATLAARVVPRFSLDGAVEVEAVLHSGATAESATSAAASVRLDGLAGYSRWNARLLAPVAAALALALLRLARGTGHITVKVNRGKAADDDAAYTVYVAKRAMKGDTNGSHVVAAEPLAGASSRFRGLAAGGWHVAVRCVVRDPKTLQVTRSQLLEKPVLVKRGENADVAFEFSADKTVVRLTLKEGERAVEEARLLVGIAGAKESVRYVRGGQTQLALAAGTHQLLVGLRDRAFRIPLEVPAKAHELEVSFDVATSQHLVFSACLDAVTPFVQGDLMAAARALDSKGQTQLAAKLRGEQLEARGRSGEAARELETAGELREAARLRTTSGDKLGAASLLARDGDYAGAAEKLREAGDLLGATEAFLRAKRFGEALACATQAGDLRLRVRALTEQGARLEAARLLIEANDLDAAISTLQRISRQDAQFAEGALLLAQLFLQRKEPELACRKLDEAVDVFGGDSFLELREQAAAQLEAKGELAAALECWEHIRKSDIHFAGSAEKIEALRGMIRAANAPQRAAPTAPQGATATRAKPPRYELLGEVGRGGMGVVYKARDTMLGRVVALKRLPDNLKDHPTAVSMFLREARSVAALNHPNVVTLFDVGQEVGSYFITMEFLDGLPLNDLLRRRNKLALRESLWLAVQTLDGLAYAHGEGIVHRDIKPSNLFLNKKKSVKIMDFGLAKMLEEVRKKSSIIAGTPYYMSPEQGLGHEVDGRTDLYAFGATLFEFLTGRVPFVDGDVAYAHRHTPAPDPRTLAAMPDEVAAVVLKLLAKKPEERIQTAAEARDRLQRVLAKLPA
jgi:tRNA A-37 threonylcarbamoyl transferase component Bud32